MEVTRLKRGEGAPDADRVYIDRLNDGKFAWMGSIDVGGAAVFGHGHTARDTVEEVEAEAIQWAQGHGAAELTIENDNA